MSARWQHGREVERLMRVLTNPKNPDDRIAQTIVLMSDGCVLEKAGKMSWKVKWPRGRHTRPDARWNVEPHLANYKPHLRRQGFQEVETCP